MKYRKYSLVKFVKTFVLCADKPTTFEPKMARKGDIFRILQHFANKLCSLQVTVLIDFVLAQLKI